MYFIKTLVLTICLFLGQFATKPAMAEDFPDPITPYISDYANLLDPETEARITKDLVKLRQELDLELALVTIDSRAEYGESASMESFSKNMFNTWGIGSTARNDGVLILISFIDREIRIELGESYGKIYDDRMSLVIDHHFLPYFLRDEYSRGIEAGTLETIKRLQPTYDIAAPNSLEKPSLWIAFKRTPLWRSVEGYFGLAIFAVIALFLVFETKMRSILVGLRPCPNCQQRQLRNRHRVITPPTESKRGEELVETYCTSCDYSAEEHRSIPNLAHKTTNDGPSGGSSGGGGGFGGGSSSGGGATGRW
ncbi:hypothetical protein GCM10007939_02990 [Amylibacter marinus]|uniref:TPM domain-containing protein n=1 Tax=Amylibacter marinus TaxID=1475483 RepID=A0ABQ5VRV0_9RHOB|nr:TPM domain-containing protein [Amylibacter marinus]GLQ34016.1 hypothetical protein GCM10007939_02990 [Amylibacter marinus]